MRKAFFAVTPKNNLLVSLSFYVSCGAVLYVDSQMYHFAASTGGLLGLFMGFSMVSVIELFYFMSLRPYCANRRGNKSIGPSSEPGYLDGVYDPKKPAVTNSIISVRPVSTIYDQCFNENVNDKPRSAFKWWRQFKETFINHRPNVQKIFSRSNIDDLPVMQDGRQRYPYRE